MSKVSLGKKVDYQASGSVEPVVVMNGTDTVALKFENDYSRIMLEVTSAAGAVAEYESPMVASDGARIIFGSAATDAAAYAEVGTDGAIGSVYISSAGAIFLQVANAGAAADWETVTTS